MNKTVVIQSGQSIFDVVLEHYGDFSGLALLLEDNPTLGDLTSAAPSQTGTVVVRDPLPALTSTNKQTVAELARSATPPVTYQR